MGACPFYFGAYFYRFCSSGSVRPGSPFRPIRIPGQNAHTSEFKVPALAIARPDFHEGLEVNESKRS
jgi:hypothetical protein